jgi:hypothetical protein
LGLTRQIFAPSSRNALSRSNYIEAAKDSILSLIKGEGMNNRCINCGFLNFASASVCKRCQASFGEVPSVETNNSSGNYSTNWQGGYEMAAQWPQPAYQGAYYPAPIAALPVRSKKGGANVLLWALLCGAIAVAAGIGFLWKFNKPAVDNYTWQEVQAPDNSFSVSMPVKPVEATQNLKPDLQLHSLTGDMKRDGFYGIAYADYHYDTSKVPVSLLLDTAAQGSANNTGSQIVSKKSITLSGYPGLEADMEVPTSTVPGGGRIACRLFWVSPRMYIVCVGGPESSSVYASRAKFLDSFRLKK